MSNNSQLKITKAANTLEILLKSSLTNIDHVDKETTSFLYSHGFKAEAFAVSLVLREGLTNAVNHAHEFDFEKNIKYSLILAENILTIEIEDQGEGFDWKTVLNRAINPEGEHGRGLIIMQKYFNKCSFNQKGNKLILMKKIQKDDK